MKIEPKTLNHFRHQVERTRIIVAEIRLIKKKEAPSEADIIRLTELREELAKLTPVHRYGWLEGKPILDISLGHLEGFTPK